MNRTILHKLLLARRLYGLAQENLTSANDISLGIGVNLLQDAVEVFLLAVSEHLNAKILSRTSFDKYFDLINSEIDPKELPFRSRLLALNKLRVNSKHSGLVPAKSETDGLVITVREFFDEVTKSVLGVAFSTVSLIDLVRDGEVKDLLREAEEAFSRGDFETCLVNCRKALFVRFESFYNISRFETDEEQREFGFFIFGNKAPFYARNKDYIDEHVGNATEYIVLDHNKVEMELMTSGIDSVSFWNLWRLTPAVYRSKEGAQWVVKRELAKFDEEGIQDRAEYVLDTAVNLFVVADQRFAATKSPDFRHYHVTLRHDEAPVYEKADLNSRVVATTPPGVTMIMVDFAITALRGDGNFWHVVHIEDGQYIWGYIFENVVRD